MAEEKGSGSADVQVHSAQEAKAKKDAEKKLEKQIILLFAVLAIVFLSYMLTHGLLTGLLSPKPYFEYEGFKVQKCRLTGVNVLFYCIPISGGGATSMVVLRNDPRTLNVSIDVGDKLDGISQVWITMPPELSSDAVIAGHELGAFTARMLFNTSYALTESNTSFYPQMNCNDSTDEIRVFLMDVGNETKVFSKDNCIVVQGDNYEGMTKAADALVLKWLLKFR
jgi:hypothetical protein